MSAKTPTDAIRKKYDFRWEVLDIIIGGKSSIDSINQGFQIHAIDDADRFLRGYGFNLENPIERAEAFGNFHEAVNFIRKYFLQPDNPHGLRIEVPRKIMELHDIRELFVMASLNASEPPAAGYPEGQLSLLRSWACSILKVMHTVAHIDQDIRSSYFADIQKQIFDRYYRCIQRDFAEQLYMGERPEDPQRINLVAFETKPKKSRNSTLLKLLHKPENVAEDIFDRVGIRFVTRTRLDALRVVKYLKDNMIVMPPNIKPSRSRNTLVDVDVFRSQLSDLMIGLERGEVDESHFITRLEAAAQRQAVNPENPHSSEFYRAIQFTARQLIKLRNPLYEDLKELKSYSRTKPLDDDAQKLIDRFDLKYLQREIRFFYPYEVQVVDEQSFEENERGRSAHSEYKKAQLQTALRRVMGTLADAPR